MGSYNIHAGHCPHGQGAYGAVGLLKESVENRIVKNRVIENLRNAKHTVYDCTDDTNCDVNTNLARIINKCNAHGVDLDVSLHLNGGRNDYGGDGSTGGVEVFCYDKRTEDVAQRICDNISKALGIRNRGVKYSGDLYVLNNTASQAILIECCFVDDKDDVDKWNAAKCGDAIASGILGRAVSGGNSKPASKPTTAKAEVRPQTGDDSQRIYFEDAGNGYVRLKNKKTGLHLDVPSAKAVNGAVLQWYPRNNTDAQLWKIIWVEQGHAKYSTIAPKLAQDKRVSVESNGNNGGVKLKLWDDMHLKESKQNFWIKQADDGTYVLVHTYSLKAITAA